MGFLNLDVDKASQLSERRNTIAGLKPVGLYKVKVEKVEFSGKEGLVPSLNFWLRIIGLLEADGETFATKKAGGNVYANAMLFFRAYLSTEALFGLENIYFAMIGEKLEGKELAEKVNSFATPAKLVSWVETWLDCENEFTVYVNHDLKATKPSEKVHWRLPKDSDK